MIFISYEYEVHSEKYKFLTSLKLPLSLKFFVCLYALSIV